MIPIPADGTFVYVAGGSGGRVILRGSSGGNVSVVESSITSYNADGSSTTALPLGGYISVQGGDGGNVYIMNKPDGSGSVYLTGGVSAPLSYATPMVIKGGDGGDVYINGLPTGGVSVVGQTFRQYVAPGSYYSFKGGDGGALILCAIIIERRW